MLFESLTDLKNHIYMHIKYFSALKITHEWSAIRVAKYSVNRSNPDEFTPTY